eukprot:scaffold82890_cov27-Tisochrysis_lutea.AAC.1
MGTCPPAMAKKEKKKESEAGPSKGIKKEKKEKKNLDEEARRARKQQMREKKEEMEEKKEKKEKKEKEKTEKKEKEKKKETMEKKEEESEERADQPMQEKGADGGEAGKEGEKGKVGSNRATRDDGASQADKADNGRKKGKREREGKGEGGKVNKTARISASEGKSPRRSPRLAAAAAAASHVPAMTLGGIADTLSADEWRVKHSIRADEALPEPIQRFADAPFDRRILSIFNSLGWTEPSPVQAQAWPIAIAGRDIIAVAKTGSGKTLGFLLPIFSAVKALPPVDANTGPLGLVLAPTRELAVQIHSEAERFGTPAGVKVACVYGGTPKGPQIGVLSRGRPAVVIATPGRINDLLSLDRPPVTDLNSCKFLVLDEADRMLDMGFQPQIDQLIKRMPQQRQTLLFTATWPKEVQKLAGSYLRRDAAMLFIGGADNKLVANANITQTFEQIDEHAKTARLAQLIRELPPGARTIVFCNTKVKCEQLAREHRSNGTCAIHGDKDQMQRERSLQQFTRGTCPLMFATDVAARGLDIKGVTNVINLDMPTGDDGVESYVHRIGRTGRAGKTGAAHTLFVLKTDRRTATQLKQLLADAKQEVPDFIHDAAASGGKGRGKGSWGARSAGGRGKGKGWGGGKGGNRRRW